MFYQVKTVNGQKTKIPLSGSVPTGNPIGSLLSRANGRVPKNYLACDGSFFDQDQYPALYLYLGSDQLPSYFDHSKLGAWETKTISTSSASPTIMDYDGIIYVQISRSGSQIGANVNIYINGEVYRSYTDTSATNYWTVYATAPVKKGDSVYYTSAGTVDKCGGWFYKQPLYIKAVDGVDITDEDAFLNTVKDYVANMMNNWVDVSSDFSVVDSISWADTPTSSLKVLYNAYQKKLKVWSWYNSSKSASSTHAFTLQYDGNNTDIMFDPTTTTAMQTLNKSYLGYDTTTNPDSSPNSNGFEGSYNIRTSKQIRLGGFCRNSGTGWGASICIVAEISL